MEEQGCQICWEPNTFPSPLEEFEGAAVMVCVVPSSCCLAAKGDFLQSNRNFNGFLRGCQQTVLLHVQKFLPG